jgi:hypothetical protein
MEFLLMVFITFGSNANLFAANSKDITVLSPKEYQVVQRTTAEKGSILINGKINVPADTVRARITGKSLLRTLPAKWINLPLQKSTMIFNLNYPIDAGGWYKIEIQAKMKNKIVAETSVNKFGDGEVFVGMGQSNSTNSAQFPIKQTSGMVSSFSGTEWKIADDPQPGVKDNTKGGSFWPAFGDAMYERYGVPIGVATTGHGGTCLDQWHPNMELFKWSMTRIFQLGPNGFRAVLWHQGEADFNTPPDIYYDKLKNIIETSKIQAGWEFPWFIARATYHNPVQSSWPKVREGQKRILDNKIALEGPDTDTLVGDNRDFDGKGIHFSPKGLKNHGLLWAQQVSVYLDPIVQKNKIAKQK